MSDKIYNELPEYVKGRIDTYLYIKEHGIEFYDVLGSEDIKTWIDDEIEYLLFYGEEGC